MAEEFSGWFKENIPEEGLSENTTFSKQFVHDAWTDGYSAGFNKANEWHYVKEGLPKDNEYVLIYTDLNNCYVAQKVENHFMSKGWGFIPMSTVIAWKEIVLPELKEIN